MRIKEKPKKRHDVFKEWKDDAIFDFFKSNFFIKFNT